VTGPTVWSVLRCRWSETRSRATLAGALGEIGADIWEFLLESLPERKRRRYGDVEYDWDHQVDTTSATVSHRTRLLAALSGAPYQPTDPAIFHEMIAALALDVHEFTFIDLGSGKGRTLLLAAEFPFRRIVGVELVPELHDIARKNMAALLNQKPGIVELVCADAREYQFPPEPTVLYLFNPLPAPALEGVIENLGRSLQRASRPLCVIYHNPISEYVLAAAGFLHKVGGTVQYSIYSN
jgi:SAM-dependent methyltransferase